MNAIMDRFAWARHEELVASLPWLAADVAIGPNAVRQTRLPAIALAAQFRPLLNDLVDGGANALTAHCLHGDVRLYVRRRGRSLDVGTREDFEQLGWGELCDLLDRLVEGADVCTVPG